MPNYLHPEAALAWARRELAGQALGDDHREPLVIQLAHWASQRDDNTQVIQVLPESAPDWALKRHARGEAVHHFVPSDATRQTLHQA